MLPGVLSDPEKLGAVSSIKAHDTKRFRVRAVSSEGEIYERFFSKSLGSKVSWCQLGLSVFVLLAQVTVMVKLIGHYEYYGSSAQIGGGIWSSIITIIAAVITLWASHKAAYGRLHASMALHIFSLLGQIFAIIFIFASGISELKRSMRQLKEDSYEDYYSGRYRPYSNDITTPSSLTIDQIAKRTERNLELYKVFHDALILNAMMGVAGISQALMSFFMSLATGRAICCGRTHLEGKFLEMEAVGREDANAVVNFRAKDTPSCHIEKNPEQLGTVKISGRDSITGPPPYSSGLFDHDKC